MNINEVIEITANYLEDNDVELKNKLCDFLEEKELYILSGKVEDKINDFLSEVNLFSSRDYLYVDEMIEVLSLLDEKTCSDFCWKFSLNEKHPSLFNEISYYYDAQYKPIRLSTRKKLANILPINIFDKQFINLSDVFKVDESYIQSLADSTEELFSYLKVYSCSTLTLRRFLKSLVNSRSRDESENRILAAKVNGVLEKDGLQLVSNSSQNHQHFVFQEKEYKQSQAPEYLIFGAIGTKPNIGISDALDGTISIISDDGDPLTYDRKIIDHLNWSDMENWWDEINIDPNLTLRKRLIDCLDSPPEQLFFKSYFSLFQAKLGEKLPALIPQVYIAYDPMRAKDLEGGKTRIRQRIDFLMLLPNDKRVIIEIDGRQHYAKEDGRADTKRYAEMVRVDRDLRLRGYEVYRFGGAEFYNDQNTPEENAVSVVKDFFTGLFKQHEIL